MLDRDSPLDLPTLRTQVLETETEWRRIDVVAETGSTNADLLARAATGEDVAGAVLLAEFQTAGRGRHGRTWSAPPRSQIAMSVGVSVADVPTESWGWLPLLTGVALVQTVRDRYGIDAGLKWPNDVLVGTGKLAGILAEVASAGPTVVVGVGLNVAFTEDEVPDPAAVSLSMSGCADTDRSALAVALLRALDDHLQRWREHRGADARLRTDYRRYSRTIATPVRALLPGDAEITGIATGIDDCGRLLIDTGTETITVSAGDITHLR